MHIPYTQIRAFLCTLMVVGLSGCINGDKPMVPTTRELPAVDVGIEHVYNLDNVVPVVVIGSGPAGLNAAIRTARNNYYTVVIKGTDAGGMLMKTSEVENWPGTLNIKGSEIIEGMTKQAERAGTVFIDDQVTGLNLYKWPYKVTTENGLILNALSVVMATGATPQKLGIPGEEEFWGRGVSACALCDAPFFKGQEVVIVGGGDAAAEMAIQLSGYASKITLLVRRGTMRASIAMQERIKAFPNVSLVYNSQVAKIEGDDKGVTGVIVHNNQEKRDYNMPVSGIFLAVGHVPNVDLVKDVLPLDEYGYVQTIGRSQETGMPGLFAAGEIDDHVYRQADVAAGEGCKAGIEASRFLADLGYNPKIAAELHLYKSAAEKKSAEVVLLHSAKEFEEHVVHGKTPAIVDFFADYCPSCIQMLPHFSAVAGEFAGKVAFFKVDIEVAPELAKQLAVQKVPALLAYKDGALAARYNKVMSRAELGDLANTLVKN